MRNFVLHLGCLPVSVMLVLGYLNALLGVDGVQPAETAKIELDRDEIEKELARAKETAAPPKEPAKAEKKAGDMPAPPREPEARKPPAGARRGEDWAAAPTPLGFVLASGTGPSDLTVWKVEVMAGEEQLQRLEDLRLAVVRFAPKPLVLVPLQPGEEMLGPELSWADFVRQEKRFQAAQYIELPPPMQLSWRPKLAALEGEWKLVLLLSDDTYAVWRTQVRQMLDERGLALKDTAVIHSSVTVEGGRARHVVGGVVPKATTKGGDR